MEKDWDNLVILDACRYDFFKRNCNIDGQLNSVLSAGSESWEFMQHNFDGSKHHDTVYVTANPHAERLGDDTFYTTINLLDKWDKDLETVHPETVADAAIEAHKKYSNKRLIIHYMQPHLPWLGPKADSINRRFNLKGLNNLHAKTQNNSKSDDPRTGNTDAFGAARRGLIGKKDIEIAYSETVNIVLDHVSQMLEDIDGKTVISSDHGEMLGENIVISELYGHYHGLWTDELRYVPWLELESQYRRNIVEEESIGADHIDSDLVKKRLDALGYR